MKEIRYGVYYRIFKFWKIIATLIDNANKAYLMRRNGNVWIKDFIWFNGIFNYLFFNCIFLDGLHIGCNLVLLSSPNELIHLICLYCWNMVRLMRLVFLYMAKYDYMDTIEYYISSVKLGSLIYGKWKNKKFI